MCLNLQVLLDELFFRDNLFGMNTLPSAAKTLINAVIATVSGLFIASAVVFGAMALAIAGLVIGLVGALAAHMRPQVRPATVTLNATRSGRGWIINPSDRS